MYKQRSRDLAVNLGDGNTKYFYRLMRKRQHHSFISHIEDMDGNKYSDPSGIAAVFVSYFSSIFGQKLRFINLISLLFGLMDTFLKWILEI